MIKIKISAKTIIFVLIHCVNKLSLRIQFVEENIGQ